MMSSHPGQRQDAVVPQAVLVTAIPVAEGDRHDALRHKFPQPVPGALRTPEVGEPLRQPTGDFRDAVGLPREQGTAVRRDAPAIRAGRT